MTTEVVEEMVDHTGTDAGHATDPHHVAERGAETPDRGETSPCLVAEERALWIRRHHAADPRMPDNEAPGQPAEAPLQMLKYVSRQPTLVSSPLTVRTRPLSLQPKVKLRVINKPTVWLNSRPGRKRPLLPSRRPRTQMLRALETSSRRWMARLLRLV